MSSTSVLSGSVGESVVSSRTRAQERNRKKKLKKKASQKRRREAKQNQELSKSPVNIDLANGESPRESSDEEPVLEFELKGPFERFKV